MKFLSNVKTSWIDDARVSKWFQAANPHAPSTNNALESRWLQRVLYDQTFGSEVEKAQNHHSHQTFYYLCNFFAPNFIVNRISSALRTPLFLEDFIFEKFENIFEKFENIFEKFENIFEKFENTMKPS